MSQDPLRATDWSDFIGQTHMKERLDVHISAAIQKVQPLPHVLLAGPPGFGKTTLAGIVAKKLDDPFASLTMPMKPAALASFLRQFSGGVLLLDEIHRCSKNQQEDLLDLLLEGYLSMNNGRRIYVKWLTIIAATTEPEKVTPALFDRFRIRPEFDAYEPDEMTEIVYRMAEKIGLRVHDDVISGIAAAAGGVPRNAGNLVQDANDLFLATGKDVTIEDVLRLSRVDPAGFTRTHLDYLAILRTLGGQAGLELVSTMLRRHPSIIREAERLLVERGLVMYGERGRELTSAGWAYGKTIDNPRRARAS